MREILFRGKDTLGCWLYGGFHLWETRQPCVMNDKLKPEEIKHIIIQNSFADWNMPRTMQPHIVIPETIGQYTGLTDKNGTKIFEGDIGRYKQTDGAKINSKPIICIGKVVYNEKTASFAIDSKDEIGAKNYDYFPIKDFEVIGNIHDNPELLEGSEDNEK